MLAEILREYRKIHGCAYTYTELLDKDTAAIIKSVTD